MTKEQALKILDDIETMANYGTFPYAYAKKMAKDFLAMSAAIQEMGNEIIDLKATLDTYRDQVRAEGSAPCLGCGHPIEVGQWATVDVDGSWHGACHRNAGRSK